jgi:putative membrane protein (TIGR04086 family)
VTQRRRLDLRAILLGAGAALALGIPASLVSQALDDTDRVDDDSVVVYVGAAVVVAALVVGGAVAASQHPATPIRHGAAAALVAFVVVAAIVVIRRTANDHDPEWLSLAVSGLIALWAGMVGAVASEARLTRRARR